MVRYTGSVELWCLVVVLEFQVAELCSGCLLAISRLEIDCSGLRPRPAIFKSWNSRARWSSFYGLSGWGEQVKKKTARQKVREKVTKKETSERVMRFYWLKFLFLSVCSQRIRDFSMVFSGPSLNCFSGFNCSEMKILWLPMRRGIQYVLFICSFSFLVCQWRM